MTGEISVFGVFVPALFVAALIAGATLFALRRLLASIGFYRLVWHRTLVDVALFVILFGGIVLALSRPARVERAVSTRSLSAGPLPISYNA